MGFTDEEELQQQAHPTTKQERTKLLRLKTDQVTPTGNVPTNAAINKQLRFFSNSTHISIFSIDEEESP